MDEEYMPHREVLEEGGWLKNGEIFHHCFENDNNYPVSFYIVAFKKYNKISTIDFIRVFGGTDKLSASISVDRRIETSDFYNPLEVPVIEFREMPIEDIKKLIKDHVEEHCNFWPDEFADGHELSIMDVFDAIDELTEEGYLESKKGDNVSRRGK